MIKIKNKFKLIFRNKFTKMSKSIIVDFFSILNHIKLGILCIPSYISVSVLSCNDHNDQMIETVTSTSLNYINFPSTTTTSLGVLTGIAIFGVISYIMYKGIKFLTHDTLTEESTNQVNTTSTSPLNENNNIGIGGEDTLIVTGTTNNTLDLSQNLNHIIYSNNYIPLGGQNGFHYIINTSHNLGFGKMFKYIIWGRKNMLGGATDEQICAYFDLRGRNKLDINVLTIFDQNSSLFISDIMPLLQGDRWITHPIPNINYCSMVEKLKYLCKYNDTFIDMLICSGSTNFKDTYLTSFFYFGVDATNASIKLQEIFLALAINGQIF